MVFADTSFLISLYGQDVNTAAARQHAAAHGGPVHVCGINEFEFANALRLLVFRQKITTASRQSQMSAYEADKTHGKVILHSTNANDVLALAEAISARQTESGGHRAYDILQVAAALELDTTEFWSFDGRQRTLAAAEGLKVGP